MTPRAGHRQFIAFVVAGGLAAIVNIGSRIIFSLVMRYEIAILVAYVCGMTVAYILNKKFVFAASGRGITSEYVRFSNRPFGVKRFQTIHHCSVDVTRGLVLLFGFGTKALPPWESKTRWNNLYRGLAVNWTAGPSGHTNSPHPSSRKGHHSTAGWSSSVLLS